MGETKSKSGIGYSEVAVMASEEDEAREREKKIGSVHFGRKFLEPFLFILFDLSDGEGIQYGQEDGLYPYVEIFVLIKPYI